MSSNKPKSLFDHFRVIEDIRDEKKRRHLLIEMLVIAITAVICGADGWPQVEAFGRSREAWFRGFLRLPNGIPSHDTFGRVFALLSPEVFEACVSFRQGCMNSRPRPGTVGAPYLVIRRPHDVAVTSRSR